MKSFVVSIHDVSPWTLQAVQVMLKDLEREGVSRCSLLVIPYHHRRGFITDYPDFVKWLQRQVESGHEAVLHGFEHLRLRNQNENIITRLMTNCYTAGEGEFYDIGYHEARCKLQQGRALLQQVILEDKEGIGFIAPAWLLSKAAEKALHDEGFLYTTRIGGVINTRVVPSILYPSQSLVYSVRSGWRRQLSLLWNECLFYRMKKDQLLRLGLHPPDWNYPTIRHHALSIIRRALQHHVPTTYREWSSRSEQ